MKSIKDFMSQKRRGAIMRVFESDKSKVDARVDDVVRAVESALELSVDGKQFLDRVDLLVFADERYQNSDCGLTAGKLRVRLKQHGKSVYVSEVKQGDLFCALLNYGVALQARNRIDYSLIMSTEAISYANEQDLRRMSEAMVAGAKASGLAITELQDSILAGRLANTFCLWDNLSLGQIGNFDLRCAMARKDRSVPKVLGYSPDGEEQHYPLAGVEEVVPLARLVDMFGPCLAPLLPSETSARYEAPDPQQRPEESKRHVSKMATKLVRQTAHLISIGCAVSFLEGGVMPAYRNQS